MVANVAVTEFTTSAVAVWLLQKLKGASWFPWLEAGRAWASRLASLFLAAVGAVGVSYTWAPNPNGGHMLTIAIPTLPVLAIGAWQWLNHFVLQETIYQATVNKPSITTDKTGAVPAMVSPAGAVVIPQSEAKA
jgi:hypothetical protein